MSFQALTVWVMGRLTRFYSKLIKRSFRRRFVMATMTKVPVVGRMMEFAFFEDDDIIILPKDEVAKEVLSKERTIDVEIEAKPENMILPSQVVEHFVRRSRYIYLMNKCMCRDANGCRSYPSELGCIFLGRGVLRIPDGMGRRVSAEAAVDHLRKCREAGLVHLIGRDKIDAVWLGVGGKENLLSICSCCECCCLWKMLPNLNESISATVTRMPGVEVLVHDDVCTGCATCIDASSCYIAAISIKDGKARINRDLCKGCGRCVQICPSGAIELKIENYDFIQHTIERIEPLVDVEGK